MPEVQQLLLGRAALVGRKAEWRLLGQQLEEARQSTRLVLVSGEPGLGKSRLLADFADQADGWRVLRGGAYEAQGQPPYVLFVEVLRALLDEAGPAGPRQRPRQRLGELARLLPELEPREAGEPLAPTQRQRLMELVAGFFRRLAAERPLLLVLDDLQWADPDSLEVLLYLRRRLREAPLLILAAYRDGEVDDEHPLTVVVNELNRLRLAATLHPRRLEQGETADLLASLLGAPAAPMLVATVQEQSEGNPFFVEELVRALAEEARLQPDRRGWKLDEASEAADRPTVLPASLRAPLAARLRGLSQPARTLLEAAALLGRRFDPLVLASTAGVDEEQVADLLSEAARRRLVAARGESYEFVHDLLRSALDLGVNPLRRRRLHEQAAMAYEALGQAGSRPAALAFHLLRSAQRQRALPYLLRAGERSLEACAYRDAVEHLSAAVELILEHRPGDDPSPTLALLGQALLGAGDYDRALTSFHAALAGTSAADPLAVGRLEAQVGSVHLAREEVEPARAAYQRALVAFGASQPAEAAQALLQLGELNLVALSRHAEGARQARRALALAEQLGRADLAAEAHGLLGTALVRMGRPQGLATLTRALDEALRLEQASLTGQIANRLAQSRYWAADLDETARAAEQALGLLRGVAEPHLLGWPTFWLGLVAFTRGEWDMAGRRAAELEHLGEQLGVRRFTAQAGQIRGMVAQDLGQRQEAVEQLGEAARLLRSIAPGTLVFYLGRYCLALLEAGAVAESEACLAELEGLALALTPGATPRNSALNMVALAYLQLGRPDRERRLERDLEPWASQLHWTLVARTLAELSLARGDLVGAERRLELAAQIALRQGARPELARVWRARARLERLQDKPAWSERALSLEAQATELERMLGILAVGVESPAAPALDGGLAPSAAVHRLPPTPLSPREREVLALIADGRSNRQIAEALSISERTAVNHVTHILAKLDLPSRSAAAVYAIRHGLANGDPF